MAETNESENQLIVSLVIAGLLGLIGFSGIVLSGLIGYYAFAHNNPAAAILGIAMSALTLVGTTVGILGNALAAPSGISSVIRASKSPPTDPTA